MYPYEDLSDDQFEALVVVCCRKLFGMGVTSFASGPDGGRDASFEGTAERYPSTTSPWKGISIIQAKHTHALNAHLSDKSFSGDSASAVLTKEIPRIKKLVESGDLDNYILFTNRRVGATADANVRARITAEAGLGDRPVAVLGIEFLNDLLRSNPELIEHAGLKRADGPLIVSSYDIAEVILAISDGLDDGPDDSEPVDRVAYDEKNVINMMTQQFADVLLNRYLVYTNQFDKFLAEPENSDMRVRYEDAVDDFQLHLIEKRSDFETFDAVFNYLVDFLLKRDSVLTANPALTRAMIFYMYWNCDLGESNRADAE